MFCLCHTSNLLGQLQGWERLHNMISVHTHSRPLTNMSFYFHYYYCHYPMIPSGLHNSKALHRPKQLVGRKYTSILTKYSY